MTVGSVFHDSTQIFSRHSWRLLVLVGAVVVPLDLLNRELGRWWMTPVTFAGRDVAEGAVVVGVLAVTGGRGLNLRAAWGVALRRSPAIVLASVLSFLGILAGFILFVVPGLVLTARWAVFVPVLVRERWIGLGLGRSWELVRGHSWVAFWLVVLPILIPALVFGAPIFLVLHVLEVHSFPVRLAFWAFGEAVALTVITFGAVALTLLYRGLLEAEE
jgi:hypothetical protein